MHYTPFRTGLHFDDVRVGDRWDTAGVLVGEAEMIGFAQEWDPQPFHVDKEAAEASVFGGLCASGLQTLLFTYRLFLGLRLFEGTTLAGLGMDQLRLHAPVFAGDTLRVQVMIAEAQPSRKPDRGVLKLRLATLNQADTLVQDLLLAVLVRRSA